MGYTHYWFREREFPKEEYQKIVKDFEKLQPLFKVLDVQLGDGFGEGKPTINDEIVSFNGSRICGHEENRNLILPWPAQITNKGVAVSSDEAINGTWHAGVTLNQRTCNGDCSYETFYFPRVSKSEHIIGKIAHKNMDGTVKYNDPKKIGRIFQCTKTAFRPYDLAVTVILIIAKHHLGNRILIRSDGDLQKWIDAMQITQNAFGYGSEFELDD